MVTMLRDKTPAGQYPRGADQFTLGLDQLEYRLKGRLPS